MRWLVIMLLLPFVCCARQEHSRKLVGRCEGCEAVFEYDNRKLSNVDTLPEWGTEPRMLVKGTIYDSDGKTPAEGVVLYIYHTNQKGIYPTRGDETGWDRRHGYLRGWIRTGKDGTFRFYTQRPATYPSRTEPAHIHPIIAEPDGKYYYLGAYFFDDDPLVKDKDRNIANPRGGTQRVVIVERDGDLLVVRRDFVLGKNIPGYQ